MKVGEFVWTDESWASLSSREHQTFKSLWTFEGGWPSVFTVTQDSLFFLLLQQTNKVVVDICFHGPWPASSHAPGKLGCCPQKHMPNSTCSSLRLCVISIEIWLIQGPTWCNWKIVLWTYQQPLLYFEDVLTSSNGGCLFMKLPQGLPLGRPWWLPQAAVWLPWKGRK